MTRLTARTSSLASGPNQLNRLQISERGARNGKARRPRILGIFEGGATQPAGMPRPKDATDSADSGH